MRISDWSSDVCSSDLSNHAHSGSPHHASSRHVRRHRRLATRRSPIMPKLNRTFSPIGLACAAVILTSLYGCAPLVVGGVASTSALVATDRRTAGAQLDDQTIELKIGSDMRNRFGDKARINAMSYDGWVLLDRKSVV